MDTADFTTDTRKEHCPIRIMYARDGLGPEQQPLHSSNLMYHPGTLWNPSMGDAPIAIIKATEHSDYSGSTVEASNYECMSELSIKEPAVWPLVAICGSHGYRALAYDATLGPVPPTWELCNALDGFENHDGIFDDDHHSVLEAKLAEEAWDDHGRKDFRKALSSVLDELDADYEHEIPDDDESTREDGHPVGPFNWSGAATWREFLVELWRRGCDELNVNGGSGMVIKTGCLVHFYFGEWVERAESKPGTGPERVYFIERQLRDDLLSIACATRLDT